MIYRADKDMTGVAEADFQFPRVTGYRVVSGQRTASPAAAPPPNPYRMAATGTSAGVRRRASVARLMVDRAAMVAEPVGNAVHDAVARFAPQARRAAGSTWGVLGAIGIATAGALGVVALSFSGNAQRAEAAPLAVSPAGLAAFPAERDRVVVGRDGSLRTALLGAAVAPSDVDQVIANSTNAGIGDRVSPGTQVDLVFAGRTADDAYRSLQYAGFHPRMDLEVVSIRSGGGLQSRTRAIAVDRTPLRLQGTFGYDARATLIGAGIPSGDVDAYLSALSGHVDTRTIAPGDRYDIAIEQAVAATGERRFGQLIYAGLQQSNGIDLRLSQWTLKGRLRWFDATEAAQSHDNIQRPVPGVVTSNYGNRFHPILGYTRMHRGLDFRAGYGTPILAVQTGWVAHAGWTSGYGQQVELTHGAGLATTYSHMSQIAARPGTLVRQGDVIGYVGATGLATGPHLHYELHQNGVAIDPNTVRFDAAPQLAGKDLAGYQSRLQAILAIPFRTSAGL